ncbi:serine hydrolase [Geminicoccaceae bacterium 1502E]|nr:serine hydrolase [Geminicoccaceae bacterium 1502E]
MNPAASACAESLDGLPVWSAPADVGWSQAMLERACGLAASLDTAALLVMAGGRVVTAWGSPGTAWNCHSIRKSLLSALIGIHEEEGRIDLEATLAAIGIDDRLGLSETERQATVLDLLTARSGVYHPSGYESPWMKRIKPPRHSAAPGTCWVYNNWDFNALGSVFRRATGADVFEEFERRIARPLGMTDFVPARDGSYVELEESEHPAYPFRMSARDLARFGELFLRRGRWQARQIVPEAWVEASVLPYSAAGVRGAYGYMWWVARDGILFPNAVLPPGSYAAVGTRGHFLVVVPALDAVIVHRVDTDREGTSVSIGAFGKLLRLILAAAPGRGEEH